MMKWASNGILLLFFKNLPKIHFSIFLLITKPTWMLMLSQEFSQNRWVTVFYCQLLSVWAASQRTRSSFVFRKVKYYYSDCTSAFCLTRIQQTIVRVVRDKSVVRAPHPPERETARVVHRKSEKFARRHQHHQQNFI